MVCMTTGLPHAGDPCAKCLRVDRIAKATREDPRVLASREKIDAAAHARDAGRPLPLVEWSKLVDAYHAEIDLDRAVVSYVWAEKMREADT